MGFKIKNGVLEHYDKENGIKDVIIPDGVTCIKCYSFFNCSGIESVTIPASVNDIDYYAFYGCEDLKTINVDNDNMNYSSIDGIMFSKDQTKMFICPEGKKDTVTLPESTTSIEYYSFRNCKNITGLTIPDSVTYIDHTSFEGCKGLADSQGFVIFKNVLYEYFGQDKKVIIPNGVTYINISSFEDCNGIESVTIPDSVTKIGDYAFRRCTFLKNVTILDGVTEIGENAFYDCYNLTSINIPESVISVGSSAFGHCPHLKNVTLPRSITSISDYTFFNCEGLQSITIPDSVTSIGKCAFYKCKSLESVTIPDSVESIGDMAFSFCQSLADEKGLVIIKDVLYTSCHNKNKEVVVPNGITTISKDAFYEHEKLESVTLPDSINYIGEYAFFNCESLTSINIPENIKFIGRGAFALCSGLADEHGFVIIGNTLYCYCGNDTHITVPENVTAISERAFSSCYSVKCLTLTDNITHIDKNAFLFFDIEKLMIRKNMRYIELDFSRIQAKSIPDIFPMVIKNDYSIKLGDSEKLDYILKNYLSAYIFMQYPQPEIENYISENIEEVLTLFIKLNDYNTVKFLAECGNFTLDPDKIDFLIDCAAKCPKKSRNPEILEYLTDYKQNFNLPSDTV